MIRALPILSLLACLLFVSGCGKKDPPPPALPIENPGVTVTPLPVEKDRIAGKDKEPVDVTKINPEGKGAYTRGQFKTLVMGKSKEEVLRRLGEPESTSQDGADDYFFYHDRTRADDGNIDELAHVVMHNGVVVRVNFKPKD